MKIRILRNKKKGNNQEFKTCVSAIGCKLRFYIFLQFEIKMGIGNKMKLKRIDLSYFNEQQLFDDINLRSYYLSLS